MVDKEQWLKTTGAHATLEAACEAYRAQRSPGDTAAAHQDHFRGCAFEDGTYDVGEEAYLTALWLSLEQQRREVRQDGKAPHPQRLQMAPGVGLCPYCQEKLRADTNCPHTHPAALYPIRKVGGLKSKQRKLLKAALKNFRPYTRDGQEVLIEGCIWQNGDFAIGPEAYDIAQALYAWHARGGTIPACDLPRPFAKSAS